MILYIQFHTFKIVFKWKFSLVSSIYCARSTQKHNINFKTQRNRQITQHGWRKKKPSLAAKGAEKLLHLQISINTTGLGVEINLCYFLCFLVFSKKPAVQSQIYDFNWSESPTLAENKSLSIRGRNKNGLTGNKTRKEVQTFCLVFFQVGSQNRKESDFFQNPHIGFK